MSHLSTKQGEVYNLETIKSGGDYFAAIRERADQITKMAQEYLDRLEFLPNDVVMDRIWQAAQKIFEANGGDNGDWTKLPEWVANTMDGWMPYSGVPRNGSLHFSLGFSPTSQDAHLRNLLEIVEGRETEELDFPVVAEKI